MDFYFQNPESHIQSKFTDLPTLAYRSILSNLIATNQYLEAKCESNPELDVYIKKPKFARDPFNYNTTREGYSVRHLVCNETVTAKPLVQAEFFLD